MKTLKKLLFTSILTVFWVINLSIVNIVSAQSLSVYDDVMGQTTDWSLASAIKWDVIEWESGSELFNAQALRVVGYIIDLFIVLWIAIAFIWGYKIMLSSKEDELKNGIRLVVYWIIWVVIMVSANFLANGLVWWNGIITAEFANPSLNNQPNWIRFSDALYNKVMFPFIKIVLYLVVWILFFMVVAKVISFVTSTDDSAKKKAWWVIIWCVVWILIIMWWKQLVEAVMWRQDQVINKAADRINEQWTESVLEFGNIPLITQVINWVMWLTMFIILVLIIIQGYKMFTKPDDPKNRESLKKTLLYIIIWVLVIGAAYAISSVLVVNRIPIATS